MTGEVQSGFDFGYDELDKETADHLNTHRAAIVQSLPPLNSEDFLHPSPDFTNFPIIMESQARLKLMKLKRTSVTKLDFPFDLIEVFPEFLVLR